MHGVLRSHSARDSLAGTIIDGRYRVLSRIGAGGMGVVYEVEHLLIGRRFALKLMNTEADFSDELFVRFQREAMAAASVGNPHIVEVTDMGVLEQGGAYLVLEYLDGLDLAQRVTVDGPFSVARAVHIALQLCDALGAVHDKRIVHRDLKPENIMLITRDGEPDFVKVLDFGICKLLEADTREAITRTNASLGTPQFMAPEQFRGSARVDARADIHAVGAILYFMLTGAPPYEAEDLPMLLMRICTEAPPSARMLRSDVPHELDIVIKCACAKRADERYQSTEELTEALLPFAASRDVHRISRVARTAREVASQPPLTPPVVMNVTAHSSPVVESAIGLSQLPMQFSRRALRVAAACVVLACALVLIAVLGARERARHAPVKTADAPARAVSVGAAPIAREARAVAPGAPGAVPTGEEPAVDAVPARGAPTRKKPIVVSNSGLPAEQHEPAPAPAPAEPPVLTPTPAAPPSAPSVAEQLERYRYPRRELRDEI